jgi:hypothetical protein
LPDPFGERGANRRAGNTDDQYPCWPGQFPPLLLGKLCPPDLAMIHLAAYSPSSIRIDNPFDPAIADIRQKHHV